MITYLLFFASLMVWAVSFFALRSSIKKRCDRKTLLLDLTDEFRGLEAEFNRVTDRNISLLEERVGGLQQYLKEADEKIAFLKTSVDEMGRAVEVLKAEQQKTAQLKQDLDMYEKEYKEKPLIEKIESLQRKGLSRVEIARKLAMPVAEIDIALAFAANADSIDNIRE